MPFLIPRKDLSRRELAERSARLPRFFRALNALGRTARRCGWSVGELSAERLIHDAVRTTGLEDFGSEAFRLPLDLLVESYNRDSTLTLVGRIAARFLCLGALKQRLKLQEALRRRPQAAELPLCRPVFILGWPRTGTTLLHNLMAQDSSAYAPRFWELLRPGERALGEAQPELAIRRLDKGLARLYAALPGLKAMHPTVAEAPEECAHLLRNTFRSYLFGHLASIPAYMQWLAHQSLVDAYREYRTQLQLLLSVQSPSNRRLCLKCPDHLFALDALLAVFPDACIVHTHRDPCEALPSACSLYGFFRTAFHERIDWTQVGADYANLLEDGTRRALRFRTDHGSDPFFDVHFRRLVADPVGTVRRIYDHFGLDYTDQFESRMRRWLAENPRHKHGKHRYSLEEFGLDPADIRRRFADYVDRFQIEPSRA